MKGTVDAPALPFQQAANGARPARTRRESAIRKIAGTPLRHVINDTARIRPWRSNGQPSICSASPAPHPLRHGRSDAREPARLRRRRRPAHPQLHRLAATGHRGGCGRGRHRASRGRTVAGAAVRERVGQQRRGAVAVAVAVRDGGRAAPARARASALAGRLLARRRRARQRRRRRRRRRRTGHASQVPRRLVRNAAAKAPHSGAMRPAPPPLARGADAPRSAAPQAGPQAWQVRAHALPLPRNAPRCVQLASLVPRLRCALRTAQLRSLFPQPLPTRVH